MKYALTILFLLVCGGIFSQQTIEHTPDLTAMNETELRSTFEQALLDQDSMQFVLFSIWNYHHNHPEFAGEELKEALLPPFQEMNISAITAMQCHQESTYITSRELCRIEWRNAALIAMEIHETFQFTIEMHELLQWWTDFYVANAEACKEGKE